MENSLPEQAEKGIDRWGRKLSNFFSTVLILVFAFTAVIATSEMAARENVLSMLTGRITTLKSEFVEQNRTGASNDTESASSGASEKIGVRREKILAEIEEYENSKSILSTLIALGSDSRAISLRTVQYTITSFDPITIRNIRESTSKNDSVYSLILDSYSPFLLLSSDQLLAIVIMACAAIGAMMAALKGNSLMTLRALSLGIATGFVVYLAIKGGKHVFLMQMQGEIVAFNPYGCAFAGLLAGLFTEKAYQLLAAIVNEFSDRLLAASTGKKDGD